jgi:hypothetical protein
VRARGDVRGLEDLPGHAPLPARAREPHAQPALPAERRGPEAHPRGRGPHVRIGSLIPTCASPRPSRPRRARSSSSSPSSARATA